MRPAPEIFFSYAWGDEDEQGESREKIVDDLYQSLINDHFKVIRDKYNLEYQEFISEFMARIGRGKCILVAISRKYVKSPYCMFELYEIARNSNFDKHLFAQRVLPIMIEFIDFADTDIIDEHIAYWENEYNVWDALLKRRGGQLSVEQMQRFDKIRLIKQNFGKLSEWIIDMRLISPRLLSSDNFNEIKKALLIKSGYNLQEEKQFLKRLITTPLFWIIVLLLVGPVVWYALSGYRNKSTQTNTQMNHADTNSSRSTTVNANGDTALIKDIPTGPIVKKKKEKKIEDSPKQPLDTTVSSKCSVRCNTNGFVGVEVAFFDSKSPEKYTQISSNSGILEFRVPCHLMKEALTVYFSKGTLHDSRTFRLKDLEIPPDLFKKQ